MFSIVSYLTHSVQQVRLGWHDAGTYNKNIEDWPQRGGANGSLRFEIELKHAANAGNGWTLYSAIFKLRWQLFCSNKLCYLRSCECLETSSAYQRQVFWCHICRLVPVGQCYCNWGSFYLLLLKLLHATSKSIKLSAHWVLLKLQEAGGPKLPMKYGRVDVSGPEQCPEEGRLPCKWTNITS